MQSSEQPVLRDIVLIGGGHSHVGVLRNFAMQPPQRLPQWKRTAGQEG